MPHVELYIADSLCDLQGDEKIEVDYTIFDITKVESRGGARSYSFELPKTDRNKTLLENPEMVNNVSQVPYSRLKCRCYVDGVDTLIRFCEVASVKSSYSIRLYGANSDLFASIKDKKLNELTLCELDHYWNLEAIALALFNFPSQGFVYPIIDYHLDSENSFINNYSRTIRADFLLPSVYLNYVLQKIFSETQYTLVNTIEADTQYLIMPSSKQLKSSSNICGRYGATFYNTNDYVIVDYNPYIDARPAFQFDYQIGDVYGYYNLPNTTTITGSVTRCLYLQDGIKFKLKVNFNIQNDTPIYKQVQIRIFGESGGVQYFAATVPSFQVLQGFNNYTSILEIEIKNLVDNSVIPKANLIYQIWTDDASSSIGNEVVLLNTSTIEIYDVEVVVEQNLVYGDFISVNNSLPDITQLELLKNYMQMFCLLPVIDEPNKTVTLIKFDEILNRVSECYDWSNKLDLTEEQEITFIQDGYGQNNNFKYKQDGDEPKPVGTDSVIIINNENLEKEKDVVELIFAGTNSVKRLQGVDIPNIGIFENGEYKSDREPRILQAEYKNATAIGGNIDFTDGVDTFTENGIVTIPYFIDAAQTFNLGFGNNLLANYYDLISDVLSRVKLVKILVRLNVSDISQLDFTRPVFIQKYEAYFYISSIKGFSYTESKSTLVELVKLNING